MVVVLAQEESRLLGHGYIGTEHLLLGVLRQEDEQVIPVLEADGVTLESARTAVVETIGRGNEHGSRQIPFPPRAKRTLELTAEDSTLREHNVVAPYFTAAAVEKLRQERQDLLERLAD
jgi:ATP-dependent Clp protease ATP-binding subunit ClpC